MAWSVVSSFYANDMIMFALIIKNNNNEKQNKTKQWVCSALRFIFSIPKILAIRNLGIFKSKENTLVIPNEIVNYPDTQFHLRYLFFLYYSFQHFKTK